MRLRFTDGFVEDYWSLQESTRARVDKALALLLANPRHPSLHVKRTQGKHKAWEARVDHRHRMTFKIDGDLYVMRAVGKHDETLERP